MNLDTETLKPVLTLIAVELGVGLIVTVSILLVLLDRLKRLHHMLGRMEHRLKKHLDQEADNQSGEVETVSAQSNPQGSP